MRLYFVTFSTAARRSQEGWNERRHRDSSSRRQAAESNYVQLRGKKAAGKPIVSHYRHFRYGDCTWWAVMALNSNAIRQLNGQLPSHTVWFPLDLMPCSAPVEEGCGRMTSKKKKKILMSKSEPVTVYFCGSISQKCFKISSTVEFLSWEEIF